MAMRRGIAAPFVGQGLVGAGHQTAAVLVFGFTCALAAVAAAAIRRTTVQRVLEDAAAGDASPSPPGSSGAPSR